MPSTLMNVAAKSAAGSSSVAHAVADHAPTIETNTTDLERWLALGVGAFLTYHGLTGRRVDPISTVLGGYLLYRAATGNCPMMQALGVRTGGTSGPEAVIPAGHGVKVEEAVTVRRPPVEVYRFWRQFSNLPRFMGHLKEVTEHAGGRSRWVARGPLGLSVEWEAELIADNPGDVISWKSLPGSDVDTAGSVHFRATEGGTEVRVALKYDPPAGKFGAAVARLFGEAPEVQVREDLARFKALLEGGR